MRTVLVHGFTQTAESWGGVVAALSGDDDVVAVEVPDGLDFEATALALGARGGRGSYVGYSMGARLCLALALERPDVVDMLVLVSGSPGIADPRARAARAADDEQLARTVERDGVEAFLERWLAQPLFASLPRDVAGIDDRRRGSSASRIAHQLRALGQGIQPSLWERLHELRMPVLVVTGAYDRKYCAIGEAMTERIGPTARLVTIGGAGHAVHLERPAALAALLRGD